MENYKINFGKFECSNELPFTLIAGPCAMESRSHAIEMAEAIGEIAEKLGINFIFKTSFDKANRTSINSGRGLGLEEAVTVFEEIKKKYNCPIITDIHEKEQCDIIAKVVDILQIPAYLCRQTDLLLAAGRTKKIINIKKGQFLAPWDVVPIVKKLQSTGCNDIMLTERGVTFGYNNLVTDMRSLVIMQNLTKLPVIFDATHSVQIPGGKGDTSDGQREFVPYLANAAAAVGIAGIFMEVHDNPEAALSDGPNMIRLSELEKILKKIKLHDEITKSDK